MKVVGHVPIRLAVTLALAALIASLIPPFIDRREYTAAVVTYANNPTLKNGVVLAREAAKNHRLVLLTRLGAGGFLFVIMNIGWLYASKDQKIRGAEPI
jgi:hypothetical protein